MHTSLHTSGNGGDRGLKKEGYCCKIYYHGVVYKFVTWVLCSSSVHKLYRKNAFSSQNNVMHGGTREAHFFVLERQEWRKDTEEKNYSTPTLTITTGAR